MGLSIRMTERDGAEVRWTGWRGHAVGVGVKLIRRAVTGLNSRRAMLERENVKRDGIGVLEGAKRLERGRRTDALSPSSRFRGPQHWKRSNNPITPLDGRSFLSRLRLSVKSGKCSNPRSGVSQFRTPQKDFLLRTNAEEL